jgi:hypothetical protein
MKAPGANYLMLRLAMLILPLATLDRAQAANNCNATSPVDNTIITCTGVTSDANGLNGYGTSSDTGNTYKILSGASVTGTLAGLIFDRGAVTNFGSISGSIETGIFGNDVNVDNAASASILSGGLGIFATNTAIVHNSGTISGAGDGIDANSSAIVFNSGTISAAGANGRAVRATTATVVNNGTIAALQTGVGIQAVSADVTNSGTISAGVAGNGVLAQTATVTNSGARGGICNADDPLGLAGGECSRLSRENLAGAFGRATEHANLTSCWDRSFNAGLNVFRPQLRNGIWNRSVKLSAFYQSGARHVSATDLTQYLLADLNRARLFPLFDGEHRHFLCLSRLMPLPDHSDPGSIASHSLRGTAPSGDQDEALVQQPSS